MQPVVVCPFYDHICPETDASLRALEHNGVKVDRAQNSSLPRTRSHRAEHWVKEGATHIVWIDADMAFEPEQVKKLLDHDLPFVCAPYFQRRSGGNAVFCPVDEQAPIVVGKSGSLIELQYTGFGFTVVRADVFERVGRSLPMLGEGYRPYFQEMLIEEPTGIEWLSEDVSFCRRARDAGITIFCDTTLRIFHMGMYPYSGEDMGGPKRVQESLTIEGAPPP